MKILILGSSGFLGKPLSMALLNLGHEVIWVSQNLHKIKTTHHIRIIDYATLKTLNDSVDVIINLAGAGIADKRWSDDRKSVLLNSRILPTTALIDYVNQINIKPKLLINGSAIGYYGVANHSVIFDENSMPMTDDFASQLCQTWGKLALSADIKHIAIIRTGIVLDNHGGMLKRLLPAFKLGLGGQLGDGNQTLSWISVRDWVNAVLFIIHQNTQNQHTEYPLPKQQVYNLNNPNTLSNRQFTQKLGQLLKRPTVFNLPAWLIQLIFGEMAMLLIDGQNVYPKHLLELGFVFDDNDLNFLMAEK